MTLQMFLLTKRLINFNLYFVLKNVISFQILNLMKRFSFQVIAAILVKCAIRLTSVKHPCCDIVDMNVKKKQDSSVLYVDTKQNISSL